jgi:uncharacterized DUF497 family protein
VRDSNAPPARLRLNHVTAGEGAMAIVPRVDGPTWHPEKARQNLAKHGVSFEDAYRVLIHSLTRHWPDGTHSLAEERTISIGLMPTGRLLLVVTSHASDGKMRIISARRATKRERHVYEDL